MTTPLVSIILPTYNGSKYLAKSIESCLQQTHINFELIIVDDCSTDTTPQIIQSFAARDQRIIYIRNKKNEKLPSSLNTGFESAKGDYYTWTSDDNYYSPDAIAEMLKAIEVNNDIGLVYCNYTTIDDAGKITGIKIFNDINKSMVKWVGCGACFLYKAQLHTEVGGYDPSAFFIEDYDFFIRALQKTKFCYLDRSDLYYYRFHAGSLTSIYGFYNFDLQKIVIERQLPNLLLIANKKDKALWLRKFTVYYGVTKSNIPRMKYYMRLLYKESAFQSFITVLFIAAQKFAKGIQVSFAAFIYFIRLILGLAR